MKIAHNIQSRNPLMRGEKSAGLAPDIIIYGFTVRWTGKKLKPVGYKHKRKGYEVHKTCNCGAEQR